jgi:hypothetical protein
MFPILPTAHARVNNIHKVQYGSYLTLLPGVSFRKTVSPTVVVALSGPGLLPFSSPNFAHVFRSATACSTSDFCRVRLILLVIWSDDKKGQR